MWVGHSCPTPLPLTLTLTFNQAHSKTTVKSVGQEWPTHTRPAAIRLLILIEIEHVQDLTFAVDH